MVSFLRSASFCELPVEDTQELVLFVFYLSAGAYFTWDPADVPDVTALHGKIVECSFNEEEETWKFMRVRPDKTTANYIRVYHSVINSIKDKVMVSGMSGGRGGGRAGGSWGWSARDVEARRDGEQWNGLLDWVERAERGLDLIRVSLV